MRMRGRAGTGAALRFLVGLSLLGCAATDATSASRLLYAEPLQSLTATSPPKAHAAAGETLRFRAFERAFEIVLQPNDRIQNGGEDSRYFTGELPLRPGAWARLTRQTGGEITGLIYDGSEYFGIEPAYRLRDLLGPDMLAAARGPLIYRLSDLMVDESLGCGVQHVPTTGGVNDRSATHALRELGDEMRRHAASTEPGWRITVTPVADYEFYTQFAPNHDTEMLTRLNIADGLFRNQVGVDLVAGHPEAVTSAAGGLSAPAPDDLLDEFSAYRDAAGTHPGISHLFSRKSFAGNVVGYAWLGGACLGRHSASLSSHTETLRGALVLTHELAHNFNAPHDGESGSACATTTPPLLMAALNNGSQTFSTCSLGEIAPVLLDRASSHPACLTPIVDHDVAVTAPPTARTEIDIAVPLQVTVTNPGRQAALAVLLHVTTPAGLEITSASQSNGTCNLISAVEISCSLDTLDSDASWPVTINLRSAMERHFSVQARVSNWADYASDGNNVAQATVTVGNPPPPATPAPNTGSTSGGGGGGGSPDAPLLLVLATAIAVRRRV